MTLLVLSDDDSVRNRIQSVPADVLVSCGDISDAVILIAARTVGCAHVLAVKGNHDGGGPFPPPIVDLHLTTYAIGGTRFGGFHGSWRYKPRGHYLYDQSEVESSLSAFPAVDVFVAHNSPRHIHDRDDDVHFGFEAFTRYIERTRPRVFIHGHQHIDQETRLGTTRVIGVYGQKRLEIQ